MMRAAALAAFSALLGGGIALVARRRPGVLELTRTFAFAAAAGVVVFHLLPEVLPDQGVAALFWIGVGFALPLVLEAASRFFGPGLLKGRGFSNLRIAVEVGFAALLFHSVVEGLALVAALARPRGQMDLEIALVAHHAPLTAAVVLPFLELKGARTVAWRALTVAAAGVAGVALSGVMPGLGEGGLLAKATAVTAGALLHVVSDEIGAQRFASSWERVADLGACAVGLFVAGVGAVFHRGDGAQTDMTVGFLRALVGLSLASAPALLVGAVASALLAARGMRRLSLDALLLAFALLGPGAALFMAFLWPALGLPMLRFLPAELQRRGPAAELLESVSQRGPSFLLLLMIAAALHVSMPAVLSDSPLWAILLLAGVLLGARLDQAGAVLLAAVLATRMLAPSVLVALLVLGPFTRGEIVRAVSVKSRARGVATLICLFLVAVGAGWAVSLAGLGFDWFAAAGHALSRAGEPVAMQIASAPFGAASAAVLIAVALGTLWRAGVRGWFAPLRHGVQES
jgi:hypothetical protein